MGHQDDYNEAFDAGHAAALAELAPLATAVHDAALMFKDIQKARQLPATAQAIQQYVNMGRHLQRLFDESKLAKTEPPKEVK